MSFGTRRVRLLLGGAALAALTLMSAGCSSDDSPNVDANESSASSTTVAVSTTAPASTVVSTVDPAPLLQEALAGLSAGYHFTSTFVVNGVETVVAEGDHIGDSSRLVITSEGASVSYVVTPTATYAQPSNGEWELLDTPPATTDPITSLNAPAAIGVLSDDGTSVRLRVTVSAVTLGVAPDGTADVEVVITGGVLTEVGYSTTTSNGSVASVATVISPVVDPTPITPPI